MVYPQLYEYIFVHNAVSLNLGFTVPNAHYCILLSIHPGILPSTQWTMYSIPLNNTLPASMTLFFKVHFQDGPQYANKIFPSIFLTMLPSTFPNMVSTTIPGILLYILPSTLSNTLQNVLTCSLTACMTVHAQVCTLPLLSALDSTLQFCVVVYSQLCGQACLSVCSWVH